MLRQMLNIIYQRIVQVSSYPIWLKRAHSRSSPHCFPTCLRDPCSVKNPRPRSRKCLMKVVRIDSYPCEFFTFKKIIPRSEEHTSELQSRENLVCRLLL